ncbi:hypothetical protein Poly30_50700 [Planctomycetes bacterium Poly30]|uniref:Uncharacterized protein n=1 Tax=Saltatorellus ferox TaxID=2528018 RepID=A0A518EZK1_9BACT|nr:hypothetical protein Poly30_50700 [Planctomycetes bacterium Poly30]
MWPDSRKRRALLAGIAALGVAVALALVMHEPAANTAPLAIVSRASAAPDGARAGGPLASLAPPREETIGPGAGTFDSATRAHAQPERLTDDDHHAAEFTLHLIDGGSREPLSFTLVGFRQPDLTWSRAFTDAEGRVRAPEPPPSKGLAMRSYGVVLGAQDDDSAVIGSVYEVTTRYLVASKTLTDASPKGLFGQRLVPVALRSIAEGIQHLSFFVYDPTSQSGTKTIFGSVERVPEPLASVLSQATHVLQVDPGPHSIAAEPGVAPWLQANAAQAFPNRQIHAMGIADGKLYHAMTAARQLPRPGQEPLKLTMAPTAPSWIPMAEVQAQYESLLRLDLDEAAVPPK